jgi:hypothetical protein
MSGSGAGTRFTSGEAFQANGTEGTEGTDGATTDENDAADLAEPLFDAQPYNVTHP